MKNVIATAATAAALGLAGPGASAAAAPGTPAVATPAGTTAALPRLLNCAGAPTLRPVRLVLACADANAALNDTHWQSWSATSATGVTRFGLNLCTPSCVQSRITVFAGAIVQASAPVTTATHGRLFSRLVVRYRLHGVEKTYAISWRNTPPYS